MVLQRPTIQKLHRNEVLTVLLADVVNGADVVVIQCGCGFGFAAKSFQGLTVMG
jgi:hypothetical protein